MGGPSGSRMKRSSGAASLTKVELEARPDRHQKIRVAIVDDEALVRTGFTHILSRARDIEVVAAIDGVDAVRTILELRPDVVLLDIRMPGKNGLEILEEVIRGRNHPVVAILTTFNTDEHIVTALRSGASGFLVKDTDPAQLPRMVRALHGGGVVLSPDVSRAVVSGYRADGACLEASRIANLTDREREVLMRLSEGRTNTEIGEALFLSTGSVKLHVSSILSKLGVGSRVEAALFAERAGLLNQAPPG